MSEQHLETKAIHSGQDPDPATGSAVVPIYATSTYVQDAPGEHKGYEYSRTHNPTRSALEECVADLEGGAGAVATASGMGATALVGYMLRSGDHVVLPDDAYGGTFRFFDQVLSNHGIEWSPADMTNEDAVAAVVRDSTRLIWVETPTNPLLRIVDLAAMAALAQDSHALLCVDNTFASPYLQRPIEYGADLVMHSSTKYLGGHSDVVGGLLVAREDDLAERLRFLTNAAGPVAGAFDAWLVLRGVKTLAVRMARHSINAMAIAEFLNSHPAVAEVMYPGLPEHPQHDLAAAQMGGFGGMVSFRPKGGVEAATNVATATELFFLAESLGGVESLIELPASMTHLSIEGTDMAVAPDLVRLSVGIEHVDDLIADLDQSLGSI